MKQQIRSAQVIGMMEPEANYGESRFSKKRQALAILDSQRTTNTVESERIGLKPDIVAKLIKDFENPTIAEGRIERFVPGNKTVVLTDGEYEAVLALTRNGQRQSWLLTGWDKLPSDDNGKVSTNTVSTQANPTFSRDDLGAVIESSAKIIDKFENPKIKAKNESAQNEGLMEMEPETTYGESRFSKKRQAEYVAEPGETDEANDIYNEELEKWESGEIRANEIIQAGHPRGVMKAFLPSKPIIVTQKVLSKSRKKHHLEATDCKDLPKALAEPIFVFKREDKKISTLTQLKDREGRNIFVAVELDVNKQLGHEVLEVNDILTIHGREIKNIIDPIIENNTLKYADKEKGLEWLSSAKLNSQAIAPETFDIVAKLIKDFENPTIEERRISSTEIAGVMAEMAKATGVPVEIVSDKDATKEARQQLSTGTNIDADTSSKNERPIVSGYSKEGKIFLNEDASYG